MTDLFPYEPPDGVEALVLWVSEVIECRANRPPGAVLPYCMITRVAGIDDKITETGRYRAHTFGTETNGVSALKSASDAANLVARRIQAFGPPFAPQRTVTLGDGRTVAPDRVSTSMIPAWVKYSDDGTIERFVAEYVIDWRFVAAI